LQTLCFDFFLPRKPIFLLFYLKISFFIVIQAVNVPAINKMMADFEKENARTEIMQEIMGDTIDDALGDGTNEEEEEAVVNQVLDEIGISFGDELPDAAPTGTPGIIQTSTNGKVAVADGGEGDDPAISELEARLNNLKR
jgi:charged multivesicular body protein 2A